nr:hypothetical protein [Kibdelosporangium sp. MJ126-NF4]CTQ96260.1 hypothetical protein [Kibdelosporangium sp. MJ126-NF4]
MLVCLAMCPLRMTGTWTMNTWTIGGGGGPTGAMAEPQGTRASTAL